MGVGSEVDVGSGIGDVSGICVGPGSDVSETKEVGSGSYVPIISSAIVGVDVSVTLSEQPVRMQAVTRTVRLLINDLFITLPDIDN